VRRFPGSGRVQALRTAVARTEIVVERNCPALSGVYQDEGVAITGEDVRQ
jgi:hypothetical protein